MGGSIPIPGSDEVDLLAASASGTQDNMTHHTRQETHFTRD